MAKDLSELVTLPGQGTTSVDRGAADPYAAWARDPSAENMRGVLDYLAPTINSEIQRFSGPKPLLRSRARAIAVRAVKSFDPAGGTKLRSWVTTQLMQLSRYNNSLKPVYTPEDAARKAYAVNEARAAFLDEHGRDPTDEELADEVGISVKRLRGLRTKAPAMVNEPEMSADDENAPEYVVYTSSPARDAQEAVYADLSDRDKAIFDGKTGLHGKREMSGESLAEMLHVSPALVSQRSAAIAERIRSVGLMQDRMSRGV